MGKKFVKDQVVAMSPLPWIGRAFRPVNIRIEGSKLYEDESELQEALDRVAQTWLITTGFRVGTEPRRTVKSTDFFERGIPQALYDLLDAYDVDASEAAAVAFLTMRGYSIPRANWPALRRREGDAPIDEETP